MSLQHAAKHLEKHGRNGDTVLVHMSKGEVKSLNDLAMAGGGQLTINPHTGLPEAGFLQRMLPMIIGAGLTATGVGAPMAALMVGGGYAAATGSLKKGLMAGLGAYGGAGIGSALSASGAAAAAPSASVSLAEGAAATPAAPVVASGSPMGGIGYASPAPVVAPPTPTPVLGSGSPLAGVNVTPTPVNAPLTPADQVIPANSMGTNLRNSTNAMFEGAKTLTSPEGRTAFMANLDNVPGTFGAKTTLAAAAAPVLMPDEKKQEQVKTDSDPGQQYTYSANPTNPFPTPDPYGRERRYFNPAYTPRMADGGITGSGNLNLNIPLDLGGSGGLGGGSYGGGSTYPFQSGGGFTGNNNAPQVAQQAAQNMPTANQPIQGLGAPQGNFLPGIEAEPQGLNNSTMSDTFKGTGAFGGNPQQALSQLMGLLGGQKMAGGGMATGGLSDVQYNLGGYSDGGRLLRGPGDGVSDSIPAVIGKKQPARLADGEFVVPARIVSELGNGSTEAGARKLYAMMDRIQKARSSTVGKGKVAKNSRADKYLPA